MFLLVDAQPLQTSSRRRGIGRYARNLLEALRIVRPDWRIEAVVSSSLPPPPADLPDDLVTRRFTPPLPAVPAMRDANQLYFGDWLTATGADVVLESSFFDEESLVPQFVGPRPALAGIAYDLIPVLFHEQYLHAPAAHAIYRERYRQALGADLLLAISDATRRDVLQLMRLPPERVVTIGGAADPRDRATPSGPLEEVPRVLERYGINRPFCLYVGGTDPRKNLHGTLAAFAALPVDLRTAHQLVIVCELRATTRRVLEAQAASLGIGAQVVLTGYVEDDELRALYQACRLSVFPSFYEGLGLPVLEALMTGAPVVASNRSSIPEFGGSAARLADPGVPEEMAGAMVEALAEPRAAGEHHRRAAAQAFTWQDTAERAAAAFERLPGLRRSAPATQPRIAWVSSVPPSESASSRASAALLPQLREAFDVELVAPATATVAREIARHVPVIRPADIWSRHLEEPFDLFVYHLDCGDPDAWIADLMRWRSGLTVVHAACAAQADSRVGRLIGASDAVLVHDAAAWSSLRQRLERPVFAVLRHGESAAATYAAAVRLALAGRRARDGDWSDAAACALADMPDAAAMDEALADRWVALRMAAHAAGARRGSGNY